MACDTPCHHSTLHIQARVRSHTHTHARARAHTRGPPPTHTHTVCGRPLALLTLATGRSTDAKRAAADDVPAGSLSAICRGTYTGCSRKREKQGPNSLLHLYAGNHTQLMQVSAVALARHSHSCCRAYAGLQGLPSPNAVCKEGGTTHRHPATVCTCLVSTSMASTLRGWAASTYRWRNACSHTWQPMRLG